jgi:IS30 family transposase
MSEYSFDIIEFGESAVVSVRWKRPSEEFHRETYCPHDDISRLPAEIQQQLQAHWTPERIAAWQSAIDGEV